MSMWYGARVVSVILKLTVCPWLTLMSVAKPWMVEAPAPEMARTLCGGPGRRFSATIGFTDGRTRSSSASRRGRTQRRVRVAAVGAEGRWRRDIVGPLNEVDGRLPGGGRVG